MSIHHVEVGTCPMCGHGKLLALYHTTYIPQYGHVVLLTLVCNLCHFKETDVLFLSEKGPNPPIQKIKLTKDTLGYLLIVAAGATVSIPKLDYDIHFYRGEIKSVEGLLLEAKEHAKEFLRQATKEEKEKVTRIINTLESELQNPSGTLEIVLKDERRYSKILPKEAWEKRVIAERKLQELGKALPPEEIKEHVKKRLERY